MLPSSPLSTAPRTTAVHAYTGCITSIDPLSCVAMALTAYVGRSLYGGGAAPAAPAALLLVKCALRRR